jgi:hypothetical protein
MTPKEEAQKLVNKFNYDNKHYLMPDAKQCALISIDEIIEQCEFDVIHDIGNKRYIDKLNYWDEVKQELIEL